MLNHKYQNKYVEYSKNESFWIEVLVGRKIVNLVFDGIGIKEIHLDDGEVVTLIKRGCLSINGDLSEVIRGE